MNKKIWFFGIGIVVAVAVIAMVITTTLKPWGFKSVPSLLRQRIRIWRSSSKGEQGI